MKRGNHWYKFRKVRETETNRYTQKVRVDGSIVAIGGSNLEKWLRDQERRGLLEGAHAFTVEGND